MVAALPTGDHPVDPFQVERWKRTKERLERQEPDLRGDFSESVDPPGVVCTLDANPLPDVRSPLQLAGDLLQPAGPLREHLEGVLPGPVHRIEDAQYVVVRDLRVVEVTHRVDEDHLRHVPIQRQGDALRPELNVEAPLVRMARDAPEALSERVGVAVVTS